MYRDKIEVKPHDLSQTVTTLQNASQGKITVEGLQTIKVTPKTEEFSTESAADGFAFDVRNPSREGMIQITIPENSPSNNTIWDMWIAKEPITISHSDPAAPYLKVSNTVCRMNRPPLERGSDVQMIEYTFTCKYLDYRGGGYALVQTA